jgi:predicted CoA-binding protein
MKTTRAQINKFFEADRIAIAGVSRNEKKFGNQILKELVKKNYDIIPINPNAEEIEGRKCYRSVDELPEGIKSILIATPKKQTDETLRKAINKGMANIWIQQMSETENTLKIAEENQKEIIFDKCVFMFAEPVAGVHKFHRTILTIFGKLPR